MTSRNWDASVPWRNRHDRPTPSTSTAPSSPDAVGRPTADVEYAGGWDEDEDDGRGGVYDRPPGEYARPPMPLLVTGGDARLVVGSAYNPAAWQTRRVGTRLVAELVPEPGNPWDPNAIAVDVDAVRTGYLSAGVARAHLAGVRGAHATGYHVLAHAKVECVGGVKALRVFLPHPDDLELWLRRDPVRRATGWTAPLWLLLRRLDDHQDGLAAADGDMRRAIVAAHFAAERTATGKYAGQTRVVADVDGHVIGELPSQYRSSCPDFFALVEAGHHKGYALIVRYPERMWAKVTHG